MSRNKSEKRKMGRQSSGRTVRATVYLSDSQWQAVKNHSRQRGISTGALVAELIDEYTLKHELTEEEIEDKPQLIAA